MAGDKGQGAVPFLGGVSGLVQGPVLALTASCSWTEVDLALVWVGDSWVVTDSWGREELAGEAQEGSQACPVPRRPQRSLGSGSSEVILGALLPPASCPQCPCEQPREAINPAVPSSCGGH